MLRARSKYYTTDARCPPPSLPFHVYPPSFQMNDASVLFELPTGSGRIVYLGYEYQEADIGWVHALIAATMYPDFVKH